MTMYDPDNEQHLDYLERHKRTMEKIIRPITEPGPIKLDYSKEQQYADQAARILGSIHPEIDLARVFKHHDQRVEDLIRACSEQVIRRRVLKAKLDFCLALLIKLRGVLRGYAQNHRDKHTLEAAQKAETNDQLADEIDAAFCYDPDPADYGKA